MSTGDLAFEMKKKEFLTVMAVLDGDTQKLMSEIQESIISQVAAGKQTMNIPFHISLGSYPTDMEHQVTRMIAEAAYNIKSFPIELVGYNDFGNRVLYLEPTIPDELLSLRKRFECDYADALDWIPHATLFCGEYDEVQRAKELLPKIDTPIAADIIGLELGEFFPPRKILSVEFTK